MRRCVFSRSVYSMNELQHGAKLRPRSRSRVARAYRSDRKRPVDSEVRIVVTHRQIFGGIVLAVDPVAHIRSVGEGLEPVEEPRGDEEMSELLVVESERLMVTESRRTRADIDEDVMYSSVGASHHLCFTPASTAVHPPYHPAAGPRLRILQEIRRPDSGHIGPAVEHPYVEGSREQPSVVPERIRPEHQNIGQVGCVDMHASIVAYHGRRRVKIQWREVRT
jgi:hypothetical protein